MKSRHVLKNLIIFLLVLVLVVGSVTPAYASDHFWTGDPDPYLCNSAKDCYWTLVVCIRGQSHIVGIFGDPEFAPDEALESIALGHGTVLTVGPCPMGPLSKGGGYCKLSDIDSLIHSGVDNPFWAEGIGKVSSLRFDYKAGGVAGWITPDLVMQNGNTFEAYFTNANPDGTAIIPPGEYRDRCFGASGTSGPSSVVTVE
ncbi:MAG: hypothetical protein IH859_02900 [Chloroflexi bacterium]|nr:hypothetical protein [Chloroflexota bacterium]